VPTTASSLDFSGAVLVATGAPIEPTATATSRAATAAATAVTTPIATFGLPATPTWTPTPVCEQPETWVVYTVQEGEVLYNLALETGTTVEEAKQVNCLDSHILSIGQEIWLPFFPPTETPTMTPTFTATPRPRVPRTTPTKTPPPLPTTEPSATP
jgi:LysM repeat protein